MAAVVLAEFNPLPVLLTCSCSHCFSKARLLPTFPRIHIVGWQWDRLHSFRRTAQQPKQSLASSRAIQPRGDCGSPRQALTSHPAKRGLPGFGTMLQNSKMSPPPTLSSAQHKLQEWKNKKREVGVPCVATYSQFKFLSRSIGCPAFETGMNSWELFQLSNGSLEQSASGS